MLSRRKDKNSRVLAAALSLALLLSTAGCGPVPGLPPVPTAAAAAAPEPAQVTAPSENEEIIYVPSYDVFSPFMYQFNFAVEREDSVWSLREVDDGEGMYLCLMRGGRDVDDPVTVASFDPETYLSWMCVLEEGRIWLQKVALLTWETSLLEVSMETGEILREIPVPEEYGVVSIFDLPDGSLGVLAESTDHREQLIYRLEADETFSQLAVFPKEENRRGYLFLGSAGSGLQSGECMACDEKALLAIDPNTGEKRELMRWDEQGVDFTRVYPFGLRDGIVRLLDYVYEEVITLTPTPRSQVKPRQELAMSCLTVEAETEKAVRDFNRRSGEYYITIRDYSGGQPFTQDVQDQAITAMNLDIVNGNMPDLLSIQDGVPFKSWAEKGFLRDLGPWLEGEGIELLPQIQRVGTVDGKLLMVCGSFSILTAAGRRDVIGEPDRWTVAKASAMAEAIPDCAAVFTGSMTREKYLDLLASYLEGYLDWDKGTASFDSPGFRDVLAFAASLPEGENIENGADAEIMQGLALADAVTVASIRDWQLRDLTYMGKLVCPGIPASDGVGSLIQMRSPMAVSTVSAHPEGAYAFLQSLLDEKVQNAYTDRFPSLKTAFENLLAEAMREPRAEEGYRVTHIYTSLGFQIEDSKIYLWDGTEGERMPRGIVHWYDENYTLVREENLYAMSEEQRDRLLALLDSAERSASYDQVIAGIVREETGAFFAGQRSAEEVSRRIQRRVELYMAEQG